MTNLRNMARGQACAVRLPGCNGGGDTTVLAHYRLAGYNGIGMKPPDIMGAWCCSRCHDIADFRASLPNYTRAEACRGRASHYGRAAKAGGALSLTQTQRNALVRVSVLLPQDTRRLRLVGRYVPLDAALRIADKPKKVKR